ncbi:PAS domain S-box protein [Methylosarcina fibrata]|uniref:PAS domain S-box protein n=1 Tax=Methylosarcina fibrata TaxID=105972 RepID=UPI0018DEDCEA|nr:PAS domain S-box protein [Methylosarcina fibrata]
MTENDRAQTSSFPVVGIGASAGGVDALRSLFKTLPEKTGLAFVVVQHLHPDHPSHLAELLEKSTVLPVLEAVDGMTVERDHVYLIGPGQVLTIENGVLRCRPFSGRVRVYLDLIDTFFKSLAADRGRQAIAVVLSGTGTDGAAGVLSVKQAGGKVLVQDPTTAMYDGMPCAAIGTEAVSHVLPVESIASELLRCAAPSSACLPSNNGEGEDIAPPLDEILMLIRRQAGFDLSGYKPKPLRWQIERRMSIRHIEHFRDYAALLQDDRAELEALVRDIPIHVTDFFRDDKAWEVLARDVIMPLVREQPEDRLLRAWTPACSTGEEAYSLAMLLVEQTEQRTKQVDFQVFATDASPEIVARASRGRFSSADVQPIAPERLERFFYAVDGAFRVNKTLRKKIVFAPQHLLTDPPFSNLDLVTCRNLLIYLEPYAQQRVLALLHASLRIGGYLFLGGGESLSSKQSGFEVVSPLWHIYRKTGPAADIRITFPKRIKPSQLARSGSSATGESASWAVLEKFDFPSVLIDEQFNILRVYGDTGSFLRLPEGQPTLNLLDLVQTAWTDDLRSAATQAVTQGQPLSIDDLQDHGSKDGSLSIRLMPFQRGEDLGTQRLLVSFVRSAPARGPASPNGDRAADEKGSEDLSNTLRITIEELKASREELQVLNEELRAVNDQLNLSNEEVNEANAQLRVTIRELETQSKVLSSGGVMTLFLDRALRVRWFTTAVSELFPLRSSDTGRLIEELVPKFWDPHFLEDARTVMKTGQPLEAEIQSVGKRWFIRRTYPYRTGNEKTTGVAITFTDITGRKQAEVALRESEERFRLLFEQSVDGIFVASADARYIDVSPTGCAMLGLTREEILERRVIDILPPEEQARLGPHFTELEDGEVHRSEWRFLRKDGTDFIGEITARKLPDGHLQAVVRDVTERRAAETALRQSREDLDRAQKVGKIGWWRLDVQRNVLTWSDENYRIFGVPEGMPQTYEAFLEIVHPDDRDYVDTQWQAGLRGEPYDIEHRIVVEGQIKWVREKAYLEFDENGEMLGGFGITQDISGRKQAEEELRNSERKFRQVVESLPQLVWTCLPDGSCDYLSPQWLAYTGVPESLQLGYGWLEQLHPDDRRRTVEQWQETTRRGGRFAVEFRIRRHDGVYRWFHTLATPLRDEAGRIVKWFGSNTDVDDWKKATEALSESEKRLTLASQATSDVIWDWDIVHDSQHWSTSGIEVFGWTDAVDGPQTAAWWLEKVHPEDRPGVTAKFQAVLDDALRDLWQDEYRFRKVDGSYAEVLDRGFLIRDAEGKPVRMIGAMQDITRLKQAEEEARAQRNLLETVIRHLPVAVNIVRASDLRILLVNPRYQRIAPQKEMIGKTVQEVWPEVPELEKIFREVAETGTPFSIMDAPYKIKRSENGPLEDAYFSWSLFRVRLPGDEGWALFNTAWETTDRRKIEETLRQALAKAEQTG